MGSAEPFAALQLQLTSSAEQIQVLSTTMDDLRNPTGLALNELRRALAEEQRKKRSERKAKPLRFASAKTYEVCKFGGTKTENFKTWATRVNIFCNSQCRGLRQALDAAETAVATVRKGLPYLLECRTYRFRPHSMFDAELYRSKEEVAEWKKRDPIPRFFEQMRAAGILDDVDSAGIEAEVVREIDEAVAFAEAGTLEPVGDLTRFVYSEVTPA